MFRFPACPPVRLWIHRTVTDSSSAGFPHSDINGSMPACRSPLLFAACHVLLRRMVPGHPPCALCSLIFSSVPRALPDLQPQICFARDTISILRPIVSFLLLPLQPFRLPASRPPRIRSLPAPLLLLAPLSIRFPLPIRLQLACSESFSLSLCSCQGAGSIR